MRRICSLLLVLTFNTFINAQNSDSLDTARDCTYMTREEKEMIYEINVVRSNPRSYLVHIEPMLKSAREELKKYGKGNRNYSLTVTTTTRNGKEVKKTDTTWHNSREELVKALESLVMDLQKMKSLSVLEPDSGIYLAAKSYTSDQHAHNWSLLHQGSDGSWPWDRITKYSPGMATGNENIAGHSGHSTPRDFVIQLLVDEGIPGYGHRYNLLDPQWTHVACTGENFKGSMTWWIQNFGRIKRP
jgi:uncharacterized protein YkwD